MKLFNGRVASVLLVMLFITMGSSPVIAGVNCNLDKFEFHPQCVDTPPDPDPDPGEETMTLENIYGWWVGDAHDQLDDDTLYYGRFCGAGGNISNGDVRYGCPRENQVHFTLPNANEAIGKEAELCSQLGNFKIGGSNVIEFSGTPVDTGFGQITAYHFTMDPTWNDGKCGGTDPSCLVRVRMTAYFDDWCNAKGKCGRLVLTRGWGNAEPAGSHPSGLIELNPFFYDQVIDIDDLEIHFMGIGTNRGVAECHWYNSGVQYLTDNPNR